MTFEVVGDLGGQLRGASGEWRGSAVGLAHQVDLAVGYRQRVQADRGGPQEGWHGR